MAIKPFKKRGIMASVLSRMAAGESLLSNRHAESMLVGLLSDAERIEDPASAWSEVRGELCESWGFNDGAEGPQKPFLYQDGVAVIPVHGILINRFNWCWGCVTGYDFIRKQKNLAMADPDVKLIVYDHDTPGGDAAGCDELAQEIYAERGTKPSLALVNTLSASAGYWLAAAAGKVVCAPSGSVGSIGVYILHMNIAKMLADAGIEAEFIKNGKFKTSGNQFESMSKEDRQYLQDMVDERAVEFHQAVAKFRGIEESVVKDTEARVMRPTEAIALGLIDAAESPSTAVASFVAEYGNDDDPSFDDSTEEATMAEMTNEEMATFKAAERSRIKGITTHTEAKGREGLAEHLAHDTDMTVEAAAAILAASPKAADPAPEPAAAAAEESDEDKSAREAKEAKEAEEAAAAKAPKPSAFVDAMDKGKHPNVGADADAGSDETQAKVAEILGAQSAAFGTKHRSTAAA